MEYLVANSVSELAKRSDLLGLTDKDKIIIGAGASLGLLTVILAIVTYLRFSRLHRWSFSILDCLRYPLLCLLCPLICCFEVCSFCQSLCQFGVCNLHQSYRLWRWTRSYQPDTNDQNMARTNATVSRRHSLPELSSLDYERNDFSRISHLSYARQPRLQELELYPYLPSRNTQLDSSPPNEFFLSPSISRPSQTASPYDYQNRYSTSRTAATSSVNSVINIMNFTTTQNSSRESSISSDIQRERTITVNINKDKKDFWISLGMLAATVLSAISAIVVPLVLKYT